MIRTVINKFLKAVLSELFTESGGRDNISLSMGSTSDIFASTSVNLENLTFRPDIFDVCVHPLHLISGHIGKVAISGIAEALTIGGKVTAQANDIYLLFGIEQNASAEQIQLLRKLFVELTAGKIHRHNLIKELFKKIQGFQPGADPDIKKRRKLLMKGLDNFFQAVQLQVRNIHVRIEINGIEDDLTKCNALGFTLPQIRYVQNPGPRPDEITKKDPWVQISLSKLQIYCDYDCVSYTNGCSPTPGELRSSQILKAFQDKWKSEVHCAIFLPFDVTIDYAAELRRNTGALFPKIYIKCQKLRIVCDSRQLEVIKAIVELIVTSKKRADHLLRVRCAWGGKWSLPPRVSETGGIHILPYLTIGDQKYPLGIVVISYC